MRILWKLRQQHGLQMVLAYVTNVLVKMNMFRTSCMLFYFAKQDHRVCKLRKHFSFLFTPFFEELSAAQPQFNKQLVHDFLLQQNNRLFLFLSELMEICGWPRPVSCQSAKQPGWRSPPIVTNVTIVMCRGPFLFVNPYKKGQEERWKRRTPTKLVILELVLLNSSTTCIAFFQWITRSH